MTRTKEDPKFLRSKIRDVLNNGIVKHVIIVG